MRRLACVLLAAAAMIPVGLAASPAGAAGPTVQCSHLSGSVAWSPPLPASGDPTLVSPTITSTGTVSGCVGGGVTGGTSAETGTTGPENCDSLINGTSPNLVGTIVFTWNTGATSTASFTLVGDSPTVATLEGIGTSGLFAGQVFSSTFSYTGAGGCTTPLATASFVQLAPLVIAHANGGSDTCTGTQTCDQAGAASATVSAPGLTATVSGKPASGSGTVDLQVASGVLPCPGIKPTVAPVADLTDTGFAPTDRLNVTATLPLVTATSTVQVCFNSSVPFKSVSSPKTRAPDTALLLTCTLANNVAPCIVSSKQVARNVIVKFVVPGGDPRFSLVLPQGREVWLSSFPNGAVGSAYKAQLQSSGGIAPIHWAVASGKLPQGCTLNAKTGAITGKPTAKGVFTAVVQATDSERPAKTAKLSLPITVK